MIDQMSALFAACYLAIGFGVGYLAWRLDPDYIEAGRWLIPILFLWPALIVPMLIVVPLARKITSKAP